MTGGLDIINARYVASAVRADQYPPGDWDEIAFIGRSNVGKSSLINSLCRHGGLARTSSTPGKTQTINFYDVTLKSGEDGRQPFFLVDLPGYGYARAGHDARQQWAKFIDDYLAASPRLRLICQLIDIRHPPQASDLAARQRLIEMGAPVQVVATKADKISRQLIKKNGDIIRAGLRLDPARQLIAYSSVSGAGRTELLDAIARVLLK